MSQPNPLMDTMVQIQAELIVLRRWVAVLYATGTGEPSTRAFIDMRDEIEVEEKRLREIINEKRQKA